MISRDEKMFFDNSVLSDYCRVYASNHEHTDKVLSGYHGEVWVSEFGEARFDESMTNRQQLFGHLKREISKILSSDLSVSEAKARISDDVFEFDSINDNLPFDLKEKYRPAIKHIKKNIYIIALPRN